MADLQTGRHEMFKVMIDTLDPVKRCSRIFAISHPRPTMNDKNKRKRTLPCFLYIVFSVYWFIDRLCARDYINYVSDITPFSFPAGIAGRRGTDEEGKSALGEPRPPLSGLVRSRPPPAASLQQEMERYKTMAAPLFCRCSAWWVQFRLYYFGFLNFCFYLLSLFIMSPRGWQTYEEVSGFYLS